MAQHKDRPVWDLDMCLVPSAAVHADSSTRLLSAGPGINGLSDLCVKITYTILYFQT